jgi:hypothetical protein
LNDSPEGSFNESVTGLKESFPEKAMAVTIVGEARKFIVRLLPSLRDLKFLIPKCQAIAPKGKEARPVEWGQNRFERVSIHVLQEAKYGPPFAPSFVSSRFHCRDEYVNTVTHFIQQAAMYLPNARSASIRQNNGPNILKNPGNLVALHRCSNLFRSGSTEKGNLTARSETFTA